MKPKVSVVIATYNRADSFEKMLKSLKEQTFSDYELILIDDGSTDKKVYEIAKKYGDVVLRHEKSVGVAKSYNKGFRISKADIIASSSSDCIADKDWIKVVVSYFDKDKNLKALMGNTKIPKSTYLGDCISALGLPAGGSIGFDKMWEVDKNGYTNRMSGCNWAIKKEVFEKIGYFDETFPYAGGEDGEYAFRMRDNNIKLKYTPEMIIYHEPRTSLKSFIKWHYARGKGYYYYIKRVGNHKKFLKNKIWSTKNIFLYNLFSTKIFLVVPLFFLSFFLQQIGYMREALRKFTIYTLINKFYKKPLGLQIEITTCCNLKCKMCVHAFSKNMAENMSLDLFKKIKGKYLVMNFIGLGSNLMNKNFIDILKLAKKKSFFITFADNFTLMNEDISRKLIKLKINRIYASIDGATKKTFESIRVGANFDEMINNVKMFVRLKKELKRSKPEIIVRFAPNSENLSEMPLMVKLVKALGLKKLHIPRLYTSDTTSNLRFKKEDFSKYKEETLKVAKELNIKVKFEEKKIPLNKCRALVSSQICATGDVIPCCFILQKYPYSKFIGDFSLGNLNKTSIKDIWNSKRYKRFRQDLNWGLTPDLCVNCENLR